MQNPSIENNDLKLPSHSHTTEALGQSEAFLQFQEHLSQAAKVDRPVLLIGERGTGKELAASRLHYLSPRWQGPLVTLNAAALPETLIESELFGHEAGAFTGSGGKRIGRFELADGGTLFLDEIGNIPMQVQEKILRVVEYGSFERVGGSDTVEVDVRIVGATNADLVALSQEGRFKRDLLDRLSFDVLFLPPLRERREDILLLASHFASRMAFELQRSEVPEFSDQAIEALERWPWPGNIRELKNVVERAVYRSDSRVISEIIFNPFKTPYSMKPSVTPKSSDAIQPPAPEPIPKEILEGKFEEVLEQTKIGLLKRALRKCRHNQKKAAQILGLSYDQFRGLYRKYRHKL